MAQKTPRHAPTMMEIQRQVADTVTPETILAADSLGRRLAELRRSGAAGGHTQGNRGDRTRHDRTRNAIRDSRDN